MRRSPIVGAFAVRAMGRWKMRKIDGVKVFSASKFYERENLDEKITEWLQSMGQDHQAFEVLDTSVTQSSDRAFHCYSMVLFYAL